MAISHEERLLINTRARYIQLAKSGDPAAGTEPGIRAMHEALQRRLEDQVDPDRQLDPEDRERRVAYLRRAHFAELARRSVQARARNRAARAAAEAAAEIDALVALEGDALAGSA